MIAYLDSSVLLRLVLGQSGALEEWEDIREGVASALVEVECLLATALLWRERTRTELVMATHDAQLAAASQACGLPVVGA